MKKIFYLIVALIFCVNPLRAQIELLHNTNLETPASYWTTSGNYYYNNYFSSYHSPTAYAFVSSCGTCGSAINNAIGDLTQASIYVPVGTTALTLSFWSYITTSETTTTTAYDILHVSITNGSYTDYIDYSNLSATSGYVLRTVTITGVTSYAGTYVTLNFHATTDVSNPTQFRIDDVSLQATVPCTYSLSSSSYICPSSSASTYSGISSVTAPGGCSWAASVTSGSSWLSTSSSGLGSGSISISVTANTTTSPRTGTINAGGSILTVTQPSIACSYSLSSSSYTCPSSSASTYPSIASVTAPSGCSWAASVTSGSSWLSTSSSGSGSGSISITVTANTSTSPRTGTIDVSGATLTITQPGIGCTYSISSSSYTCPSSSASTYTSIVGVTAPSSCGWSASVMSGSSWLSTSSSGSGSGSISITVSANTGSLPRFGTIDISGNTLTVTQPGVGCIYSLSSSSYTCPNASTSTYTSIVGVTSPSGCSWTANVTTGSSWLSTTSSGTGSGSISITVTANTSTSARIGIIDVSGSTLTITQPASVTTPTIVITSPNGGENWPAATLHSITGSVSSSISSVQLEYTTDNGITFLPISTVPPVAGMFTYSWTAPATPSTNCKIRATGYGSGTVTDLSNAVFTISIGCFPLGDDYPYSYHADCNAVFVPDAWNMYIGQCTSWVCWKINQAAGYTSLTGYHPFSNNSVFGNAIHLGNAVNWKDVLSPYYPVNGTPAPGAIGWYRDHTSDPDGGGGISGHVTFVNCVSGNNVTLTEYNFDPCAYKTRTVDVTLPYQAGNRKPDYYIHVEAGGFGAVSGFESVSVDEEIQLYPNPVDAVLYVELPAEIGSGSLMILNSIGQLILQLQVDDSSRSIDMSQMSPGLYILKYNSGPHMISKKIIKR